MEIQLNKLSNTNDYQYIVYACPTGELNNQLERYWHLSRQLCRENAAHKYMPHCSLTGFFAAKPDLIPTYLETLNQAYIRGKNARLLLNIEIKQLTFKENWHGLELKANNLKTIIANFSQGIASLNNQESIRLKDWLHLSLAYDFNPKYQEELKQLAQTTFNLPVEVNWELRFYQKNPDWSWKCLQFWQLP